MGDNTSKFLVDGERLLEQFENAEDLLQENALFAKIFYSLCQGMSPYKAIEELVGMVSKYHEELVDVLHKTPSPGVTVELTEENMELLFREAFFSDSDYPDW